MTLDAKGRELPNLVPSYRAVLTYPTDERAEVLRLWATNLRMTGDLPAILRWQYLEGPLAPGQMFLLRAPAPGDAPVGCAGVTTRELWCGERPLRAAHFANFAIDQAHRTALPAIMLQRAVKRHVEGSYDLGFGFPNRNAVAVYRHVGYRELGEVVRHVRVLRHGGYLERVVAAHPRVPRAVRRVVRSVARAAGVVLDRARLTLGDLRAAGSAIGSSLTWLDDVDERFDALWLSSRPMFAIASRRDAAFLRWRFLRKPDERYVVAALVQRRTARLRAYAIVRGERGDLAEIVDAFGDRRALDDLLARLVPAVYRRGHTGIAFRFAGDPAIGRLLGRHGFKPREASRSVVLTVADRCPVAATVRDLAAWYLTELDMDT